MDILLYIRHVFTLSTIFLFLKVWLFTSAGCESWLLSAWQCSLKIFHCSTKLEQKAFLNRQKRIDLSLFYDFSKSFMHSRFLLSFRCRLSILMGIDIDIKIGSKVIRVIWYGSVVDGSSKFSILFFLPLSIWKLNVRWFFQINEFIGIFKKKMIAFLPFWRDMMMWFKAWMVFRTSFLYEINNFFAACQKSISIRIILFSRFQYHKNGLKHCFDVKKNIK